MAAGSSRFGFLLLLREAYMVWQHCAMELPKSRRGFVWGLIALGLLFLISLGVSVVRGTSNAIASFGRAAAPTVTHDVVMERLRDVAKLVASEMTLRDVIIYEQTRFRSTKRALLVATGKVSAGINLRAADVQLDSAARRITITLPAAQVLSIDVTNITTYDESAGLLNPFTPDDRDEIQRRIRSQLMVTARQSGILEHADRAAAQAVRDFLKLDGYTVEVKRPIQLEKPAG
jgi:uncharacterized protein DUF4230